MRKKTQNRTPFRLAHGLSLFEPLTPHRRGLRRQSFGLAPGLSHFVPRTARSDQSLSPRYARELLPQPLCGR